MPNLPPVPPKIRTLAIAWLREEDWPRWLSIDSDFQPDYQHWLRRMNAAFAHYKGLGHPVEKVVIDVDEFLEWSRAHGGQVNTNARATFASYKAMRKHTDH